MLGNYRTSNNIKEISRILSNKNNSQDSYIWQNINGKRYIFNLENIIVNTSFMSFSSDITSKMLPFFDPSNLTYCKLNYKQTVFKVLIVNIIKNKITFNIPQEIQTLEFRNNPRQKFKPSDGKYVTIEVGIELIARATQALKFQVIDIAENGLSIVVSDKNIRYFEDGFSFSLTKAMDHELISKIGLDLIYFQQLKFKQKGRIISAYRVGLKLKSPLTTMQLAHFF